MGIQVAHSTPVHISYMADLFYHYALVIIMQDKANATMQYINNKMLHIL